MGIAADYRGPSGKTLPGIRINATEITENYARCLCSEKKRFWRSFSALMPAGKRGKPQTSM
ncbi:MAG TPA: hypothetical protein PK409_09600, partial [Thermosynergistes sp.]|nr:hypothetical protein [Thermosynergistes sp.]